MKTFFGIAAGVALLLAACALGLGVGVEEISGGCAGDECETISGQCTTIDNCAGKSQASCPSYDYISGAYVSYVACAGDMQQELCTLKGAKVCRQYYHCIYSDSTCHPAATPYYTLTKPGCCFIE